MVEDLKKTIEYLDGTASSDVVKNVVAYSNDDLKKYSIELDSLDTAKTKKIETASFWETDNSWQNLVVGS